MNNYYKKYVVLLCVLFVHERISATPQDSLQALQAMGVDIQTQRNATTATIANNQQFDWHAFITNASALPDLARLQIEHCPTLTDLKDISKLTQLKELHIGNCLNVKDLRSLQGHPALEVIHFNDCHNLRVVNGIDGLPRLRLLEFHHCLNLSSLTGLKNLPRLEELWIPATPITSQGLQPISNLFSLTTLDLSDNSAVRDLHFLAKLSKIKHLNVANCTQIIDVAVLKRLPNLSFLNLAGTSITSGKDISGCQKVSYLTIGSPTLQRISLFNLPELRTLEIYEWPDREALGQLASLPSLVNLVITSNQLTHLNELSKVKQLKKLDVGGCRQLKNIKGLENANIHELLISSSLVSLELIESLSLLELLSLSDGSQEHRASLASKFPSLRVTNLPLVIPLPD